MDKRLLRQIEVEKRVVQSFISEQLSSLDLDFLVIANRHIIDSEETISLDFHKSKSLDKVSYRVFITKDDYITQDFTSKVMKWKVGALDSITRNAYWYLNSLIGDDKSTKILKNFLGVEEGLFRKINKLQEEIKKNRLEKQHQTEKDRIDNVMKDVPNVPKSFGKWAEDIALYHSRYIYYEYKTRKVLDGYCTHCNQDVRVEGAKHNKEGICPNCNSQIVFKASGKSKNIQDYAKASIIQKLPDNSIVIRHFNIWKSYSDYRATKLRYTELVREIIDKNGKFKAYEFNAFKQTDEMRWCEGRKALSTMFYSSRYDFSTSVLYTRNLSQALKDTRFKYCAIREFIGERKGFDFSATDYLVTYLKFPGLEYLVKLQLRNLTNDLLYSGYFHDVKKYINFSGINLYEVLGVDKKGLKRLQRLNPTFNQYKAFIRSNAANFDVSDEQIRIIATLNIDTMIGISEYTTINKILKYIEGQGKISAFGMSNILIDWKDYIADCKTLNYNLGNNLILMPKDLNKAHQDTRKMIRENKDKLYNERMKEMHDTLSKQYSWEDKEFSIIAPKSYDDLVKESNVLNHCVKSYAKDIIDGDRVVLFLRDKKDISQSFYTVEVKDNEIKQCRGKNNSDMDDRVEKIINKYKRKKLQVGSSKRAM